MTSAEATAILDRLTCKSLRCVETPNGIAWSTVLCLDGKPVLVGSNTGNGGSNTYAPPKGGDWSEALRAQAELTEAARILTGTDFEPLDALTAALDEGATGTQAAALYRLHFAA